MKLKSEYFIVSEIKSQLTNFKDAQGIIYNINAQTNTAVIIDFDKSLKVTDVIIPNKISCNGMIFNVVTINTEAFYDCNLKSVHFQSNSNIKIIDVGSFAKNELTEIDLSTLSNALLKFGCFMDNQISNIKQLDINQHLQISKAAFAHNPIDKIEK